MNCFECGGQLNAPYRYMDAYHEKDNPGKATIYAHEKCIVGSPNEQNWRSATAIRTNASMRKPDTLTIRFEVHDRDVTSEFLVPFGQIMITDVVQAKLDDGGWEVSGEVGGVPFAGRGGYKVEAILNYLYARLISGAERKEGN